MLLTPFFRFFFYRYADPRDLPSFPTRRSSDLRREIRRLAADRRRRGRGCAIITAPAAAPPPQGAPALGSWLGTRSEEHTSELQSLRHLVCRLLLEKKKKNKIKTRLLTATNTTT